MNVGSLVAAGAVAAGGAVLGGAATYGAVTYAGESDGGTLPTLAGMTLGNSLIGGFTGGMAANMIAGRIPALQGIGRLLAIPAGIAGAFVGSKLAHAGLQHRHPQEYDTSLEKIDESIEDTRAMFRDAGAGEDVLARVPESYDRSFFNARYAPPLGPFRNDIVVGRNPDNGSPLAINDVIAHEFSHKVIAAYAPELLGGGNGAAMHESLADTFAMAVDTDDWLVGEDAWPGGVRSFSNPELRGAVHGDKVDPAPITREQLAGAEAHLGAGVGNKAAWRIGDALGRETMAKLYVAALERNELHGGTTYADLAHAVRGAATDLYGAGSHEAQVVDDAWRQAGY
jgi:hypothetical protein